MGCYNNKLYLFKIHVKIAKNQSFFTLNHSLKLLSLLIQLTKVILCPNIIFPSESNIVKINTLNHFFRICIFFMMTVIV